MSPPYDHSYEPPDAEAFAAFANSVVADLPDVFRRHLEPVVIRIEEVPDADTIRVMNLGSPYDLLGLYRGIDVGHKEQAGPAPLNDTIFLYRKPILLYRLETGQPLDAVVRHVLIHEIGHHFGLSDDDMHRIEDSAD
ncbi:MAG: metallopeptidase family protein [Pseudomonadota bacterium]